MPDETIATPAIGDGVVTIPIPGEPISEDRRMPEPIDLPPNVMASLQLESVGNIQASNRNSRGVFDAVMGALAGTVQTNFAEVGVLEGRSVSGVLGTPVAGPTNAQKTT